MKIDKYKVMDHVLVFLLYFFPVMAILAYPIAYWPHYEKKVYEQQEVLTQERMEEIHKEEVERFGEDWTSSFTGYPTKGIHTELVTNEKFKYDEKVYEDINDYFNAFSDALDEFGENIPNEIYCLEVDVNDLEPTGLYEKVYEFSKSMGASGGIRKTVYSNDRYADKYQTSYLKTVLNRGKAIYAQYYALTLEDDSKILILLNDTVIDIPKKGKIQLPLAEKDWLSFDEIESAKNEVLQKYNLNYSEELNEIKTLNAAKDWFFLNDDIEDAYKGRRVLWGILCFGGIIGALAVYFGSVILLKHVK